MAITRHRALYVKRVRGKVYRTRNPKENPRRQKTEVRSRRRVARSTGEGVRSPEVLSPVLIDISIGGRMVKAVAQPTKQGMLYTFNRLTGEPIWPIEERPVPKGDVPGEWYSPTQPFPTKPPAYGRAAIPSLDDLIDFTPELGTEALQIVSKYRIGLIFTPIVVSKPEGPFGTILTTGVTNWPGGSYDPESHILYVHASTGMISNGLVPGDPAQTEFAWVSGNRTPPGAAPPLRVQGLPLVKPPYRSSVAIDMRHV
jgi:quinoprotein glucose dehydrogenase